jgi:4'-phosphopantetheinyl transferase
MMGAGSLDVAGPPAGIVDVWCVALDELAWSDAGLDGVLDPGERRRAERMRVGGREWSWGRGAQRTILAHYLGLPAADIRFDYSASGKPRLAGDRRLAFSFARTDGLALLAVSRDRELGVDVERENPRTDVAVVAREFLSPLELAAIECAPVEERRAAFFRAWVRHEARLKLLGHGLAGDPGPGGRALGAPLVVRSLALQPGFAAALAAEGGGWSVRVHEFELAPVPSAT